MMMSVFKPVGGRKGGREEGEMMSVFNPVGLREGEKGEDEGDWDGEPRLE